MIPAGFEAMIRPLLGDETETFLNCLDEPPCRALRLNPRRENAEAAASPFTEKPVPWCAAGRYLKKDVFPGRDILHAAGAYYLQEPSAMASAEALCAQPGEWVLDLCAAPGGKSGRLADQLMGCGVLVANEIESSRARILASNLERLGVTNAIVTSASPEKLARLWPNTFDAILTDAPCSGEGMFRRVPEARNEWTTDSPRGCAARQAKILDEAARMLRPGGRLVYSTCTFNAAENEDTISAFLARRSDFSPADFELPGVGASVNGCVRLWPHRLRGEGHFVAMLRREGQSAPRKTGPFVSDKAARAALGALSDAVLLQMPSWLQKARITLEKDLLIARPEGPEGPAIARGVALCRVGRGYVVPEHALAMALLPAQAARTLPVEEDGARALLKGLSVDSPCAGWTLATYQNMPLCWGKSVDGIFKNHLPKGLRLPG